MLLEEFWIPATLTVTWEKEIYSEVRNRSTFLYLGTQVLTSSQFHIKLFN
jgi:hypothetical protein